MTKKTYFILAVSGVVFFLFLIIIRFLLTPTTPSATDKVILVDGKNVDIVKAGVNLPIDKDEAFKIAKNFCNLNLQKTFQGDIYGQIGELENKWYIQMNIVNCLCGVIVDKKTGETICYKNLSNNEALNLK